MRKTAQKWSIGHNFTHLLSVHFPVSLCQTWRFKCFACINLHVCHPHLVNHPTFRWKHLNGDMETTKQTNFISQKNWKRTAHVKLWTLLNFCEAEKVFDHKLGKLTEVFLKQQLQADISCCSSWNLHSAYAVPLDKLSWFAVGLMLLLLWTPVHRWALLMERNFCRCFAALCVLFFTFLIRASLRETVTGLQNTFKL